MTDVGAHSSAPPMLGFSTTSEQVVAAVDLSGKTAVVTGASSGLGLHTAATLARAGAHVVAAIRNPAEFVDSEAFTAAFVTPATTQAIQAVPLDLASLASVRATAERIRAEHHQIDILINNAGVMFTPEGRTADGFELQFGVNHLGHFHLTTLLLPQLKVAAANAGNSRVVTVTSEAHQRWPIDIDDINFERRGYDTFLAYGQSKSANVLMTVELDRRYAVDGITALAVHPGTCATALARHMDKQTVRTLFAMGGDTFAPENMKTVSQAAATAIWAATDRRVGSARRRLPRRLPVATASPEATDANTALTLWQLSERWVRGGRSSCD